MTKQTAGWIGLQALSILWALGALAPEPSHSQHLVSAHTVPKGLSASDWTNIRASYYAHRHQAVQSEDGYRVHNPEQHWKTEFDGRGFTIRPDGGGWEWGLELKSYGFTGEKRAAHSATSSRARDNRITYVYDAALSEWFVNDTRGLEHGFTLNQPPTDSNKLGASLEFDLAVRGNLRPQISPEGGALRFVDAEGAALVTYSELKVWDAEGRSLPTRFLTQDGGVRLIVDASGARYPVTVDPIAQQAYLKASYPNFDTQFGNSTAISGDTVVVGVPDEDSNATGINGDPTDTSADLAGAVYVFVRNGATWTQQAYLKASNTDENDHFGYSVAISGDTIVVSAPLEASNATGVNGSQTDNSAGTSGAAYVFVRTGATWTQQAYLKASNTEIGDGFGTSVAASGDTVVVGAHFEDSNATGINGDQADNSANGAGAAYVFVRHGVTWMQQAYLKASNAEDGDEFGYSVTVSGDTVIVAAPREDSSAVGVDGNQTDNSALGAGAAYVFVRNSSTWTQQAYLKASNTGVSDFFGGSVAASGDTVVVGAFFEDSNATGVNGDQSNNYLADSGAAYVFVRNGSTWTQQAYLKASNTQSGDAFGFSVASSGDTVVVGAPGESSSATGVNSDPDSGFASSAGAAYVFVRNGSTWAQEAYLKASNPGTDDSFGSAVAISGDTMVAGAPGEDSNATGVNGNQSDDSSFNAGAAYVFSVPTILGNISTRVWVGTGDKVAIGGFIVTGSQPKQVLLRALGPSLPLAGILADPSLELRNGAGNLVASNDNWMDSPHRQEIIDTMIPPPNKLESAILATLDPGSYTAIMRGAHDTTGIGLVETYDLASTAGSQLANVSTRGLVGRGNNVMIGGFILVGPSPQDVLIRAIGPSLPVADKLADPVLELHDKNGATIADNDNWRSDQEAEIIETTIPPHNNRESAIRATLLPDAYTAIVRGKGNTTGVALVEVYVLNP